MTPPPAADTLIAELRVEADIAAIPQATAWLASVAEREGWADAMRFGLELSLEEALTNVISYGFAGVDRKPVIRIEVYRRPQGRVVLQLIDNGVAFDPTTLAEPEVANSIEEAKIGGHGVQLMRHFLESLAYRRVGEENQLILVAAPAE